MDFTTFLDYHGTTIADALLYHYVEMFDNFCQFQYDIHTLDPQTKRLLNGSKDTNQLQRWYLTWKKYLHFHIRAWPTTISRLLLSQQPQPQPPP